ncbi:HYKK-like protein [Mya arenaria]|uniref:Hydroxylysine kinase n=1 Tax=Mya arenaria TaxID=6604 RepID=A0ABY7EVQ1_MYAAR|nr:hydroxylysine kinase-like [Mya arenaria]WAR13375.1 HYKK-like protein [Mya arenaria]
MAEDFKKEALDICLRKNYNKILVKYVQLDGYEDLNFLVVLSDIDSDKHLTFGHPEEFILKICTKTDEHNLDLQFVVMDHLHRAGIPTCRPLKTTQHRDCCFIDWHGIGGGTVKYPAYLLTYIPGVTMLAAGNPGDLLLEAGRLAGRVSRALQTLSFKCDHMDTLWEMSRLPELSSLVERHLIGDDRRLGENIIKSFSDIVVPLMKQFRRGIIHGDINNCNIIVRQDITGNYVISGIIDFGDACSSFSVSDIVIVMADLMTSCFKQRDILDVAHKVYGGYVQEFPLINMEYRCLRVLICSRLLQMYVLNAETLAEERSRNDYVALEHEESLTVCKVLWKVSDQQFYSRLDRPS